MGTHLWAALQPVVDLTNGAVVGHESLLRGGSGTDWEFPAALFAKADNLGHRVMLEAIARDLGLRRLGDLPPDQKLFLNIDARNLEMPPMPGHRDIDPRRVVLEISEQQPILTNPRLMRQVTRWRSQGHAIALDDYGSGYMGIGAILMLKPEILKADRALIADIDQDSRRQVILKHLVSMCHQLNVTLIAEGIETPGELSFLRSIKVKYGQGFLLGRPQKNPVNEVPEMFFVSPYSQSLAKAEG